IGGDVTHAADVERAMTGCDYVFHCAYGNAGFVSDRTAINIEGTQIVMDAAARLSPRRVVYLSTAAVYGSPPDGPFDESAPRAPAKGDFYAESKTEAERRAMQAAARGVPVTVIQPTVVYGPFSTIWTTLPLNNLKRHREILIDGGIGSCNSVYIDDLVTAMLLASVTDAACG